MATFQKVKLGDVITLKRGYDLPSSVRKSGLIPVVSSSGITGLHNVHKVQGPGVVTGRYGSIGEVFYLKDDYWPLNTSLYVEDFKGNHVKFIAYFLQNFLKSVSSDKAAVPGINRNEIHSRDVIFIKDKTMQAKIAEILSAYDNLIENNEKRIKALEEMAQLLYTEWFVKFKFPGHEKAKMVDSGTEYGTIPDGWEVKRLGDLIRIKKGRNITRDTVVHGTVPVVAGGLEPAYFHDTPNTKSPVVTISASGANAGFTRLYFEDLWASDCSFIDLGVTPYVYFYYLFLINKKDEIARMQRGSAQPHVYPKDLMELKIIIPQEFLMSAFHAQVRPIFELIGQLIRKRQNLSIMRDLLIPQLVTGKRIVQKLIFSLNN